MLQQNNMDKNYKIIFPNLLLIPILSIICAVIKFFNNTDWNWIVTLVIAPISIYFIWAISYLICLFLCIFILSLINKYKLIIVKNKERKT